MQEIFILLNLSNRISPGLFISNNPDDVLSYQKDNNIKNAKMDFLFDIFNVDITKTVYLLIDCDSFSVSAISNIKKDVQIYRKDEKIENTIINKLN